MQLDTEIKLWCESILASPPKLNVANQDSANVNINNIHEFLEACLMFGVENWAMKKFLQELRDFA